MAYWKTLKTEEDAIFDKEFKSFFYSPLAYVIIAIFTLITGYLFYNVLSWFVEQSFMMTMQAQQYRQAPPKFNVNLHLIRGYFGTLAFISLFVLLAWNNSTCFKKFLIITSPYSVQIDSG